jgi:type III pantothenate kinase
MEARLVSVATKVLVVDAGNTSIKYTAFDGEQLLWVKKDECDVFDSAFVPDAVYFASVQSKEQSLVVANSMQAAYSNSDWVELVSEGRACGVVNAYLEPERLGVDRWLGVIAAHHLFQGDVLVVDAGTAIKVDFVNKEGNHLGGYIVPGLSMMEQALLSKTARIQYRSDEVVTEYGLPNSTARAVVEGCHEMALGFLERIHGAYPNYKWVVTGGDAQVLVDLLDLPLERQSNLVALGAKLVGDELLRGNR